ncbi:MAG TPA: ArdC-like ssDNA-binding domain-containing protein [Candidatus Polarisedimenticolia bacterium]|nr:ArdC-like ssDNA-binding domain-containing protein [Candidatus Polarisedimenticolia bacterium]
MNNKRQDVYTRVTGKIIADLEQSVRTWMKPWNAPAASGSTRRRSTCSLIFGRMPSALRPNGCRPWRRFARSSAGLSPSWSGRLVPTRQEISLG